MRTNSTGGLFSDKRPRPGPHFLRAIRAQRAQATTWQKISSSEPTHGNGSVQNPDAKQSTDCRWI